MKSVVLIRRKNGFAKKWFKFFIVNLAIHLLTSVLKEVLISDVMSSVLM